MILHFRSSIGSPQRSQVWTSSLTADRVTGRPELAEGGLVTPSPSRGDGRESISKRHGDPTRSHTLERMDPEWSDPEQLRAIFDETRIVRKPLTGIITGYHVLPYILVAPEHDHPARAVEVRGRIKVSPRLVIAAGGDGPTYGELFGGRGGVDGGVGGWGPGSSAPATPPGGRWRARTSRSGGTTTPPTVIWTACSTNSPDGRSSTRGGSSRRTRASTRCRSPGSSESSW